MTKECKKTTIESQFGLKNMGNTCYLNASIQTLLSFPNLPEIIAARKAQLATLQDTGEDNLQQAQALCILLEHLLQKQYGKPVSQAILNNAWALFIKHTQSRIVNDVPLGRQQEDSNFSFLMLVELLSINAPLMQNIVRKYEAVNFKGTLYPAKEVPALHRTPCITLPWTTHTPIENVFEDTICEVNEAKHPDAYEAGMKEYTPCIEVTQVHMEPKGDTFVLLPNHSPLKGSSPFAPTQCHYHIPGEVELTIQGVKDTFVLASFSQKIGSAAVGHYIAYRREGTRWYEIDDNRVSTKGYQLFSEAAMPEAVTSALKSEDDHCARQLIYVRKSVFLAQYQYQYQDLKKQVLIEGYSDILSRLQTKINLESIKKYKKESLNIFNYIKDQLHKFEDTNSSMTPLELHKNIMRKIDSSLPQFNQAPTWKEFFLNILRAIANLFRSEGNKYSLFKPVSYKSLSEAKGEFIDLIMEPDESHPTSGI